jgi:hypothetical protein
MALQPFYCKGPLLLLWAGSRSSRGKTTLSCIPNCNILRNFYSTYTIYKCGRRPHRTTRRAAGSDAAMLHSSAGLSNGHIVLHVRWTHCVACAVDTLCCMCGGHIVLHVRWTHCVACAVDTLCCMCGWHTVLHVRWTHCVACAVDTLCCMCGGHIVLHVRYELNAGT